MLKWLARIDNTDWVPPAIKFFADHKADTSDLHRFLVDLERLAAFLMICRYGINERIERYGKLLECIENEGDLYDSASPLQLSSKESRQFLNELNGDIYQQVPKRRLYILLRLDSALSDGSATYEHSVISIEHVLPQNPPSGSEWCEWFPSQELRDKWVHRLGNLLLLNHKKNSSANNYDFERKKRAYFTKGGVSPFPLTTQAVHEKEWTLEVVARRQKQLVERLKQLWRIDTEVSDAEPATEIDGAASEDELDQLFTNYAKLLVLKQIGKPVVKRSRVLWETEDGTALLSFQFSKKFNRSDCDYWFGLGKAAKESLEQHRNASCAFALCESERVVLLPYRVLGENMDVLYTSPDDDGGIRHWHVRFREKAGRLELLLSPGKENIDVSDYIVTD